MTIPKIATAACIATLMLAPTTAFARHHHHHYRHSSASYDSGTVLAHPAGCPHTAFCGCGVSVRVFGHSVRSLWLAANWLRFPRTSPAPGMVAVYGRHHAAYIEALDANGNAVLYDPNSGGHATRRHTRSLAGAVIVNPNG